MTHFCKPPFFHWFGWIRFWPKQFLPWDHENTHTFWLDLYPELFTVSSCLWQLNTHFHMWQIHFYCIIVLDVKHTLCYCEMWQLPTVHKKINADVMRNDKNFCFSLNPFFVGYGVALETQCCQYKSQAFSELILKNKNVIHSIKMGQLWSHGLLKIISG